MVTDPGAVISAIDSCTSLSAHSAVCTAPDPPPYPAGPYLQSVRALLGDMNDRAITTRTGPYVIGGIDAFGGPGDDVLTGSPAEDVLDGGGGTDVLTGGDGGDMLTDGDRDGAAARIRPDADMLDGGPGIDTLSYSQRTRRVVVDLATDDPVGEPGEGDVAPGFEWVTGGKGDDRLAGDGDANYLDGRGGSNLLIGRGGNDWLYNASGPAVRCGPGSDLPAGADELAGDRDGHDPGRLAASVAQQVPARVEPSLDAPVRRASRRPVLRESGCCRLAMKIVSAPGSAVLVGPG